MKTKFLGLVGIDEVSIKVENEVVRANRKIELVMALEEEFNCEIPDEEAENITTVQQAIDYVTAHTS